MAKKQPDLRVYKLDRDESQVLYQIAKDVRDDENFKHKWDIPVKEGYWCNIKINGDEMELRVECLKGGYRSTNRSDLKDMKEFAAETKKLLGKFEKAVRSEFKKRVGKSLKWGKGREYINYEPVALNNLYKFYAVKTGPIKVELGGQEFSEDGPELNQPDKSAYEHAIVDLSKLDKKY